MEAWDRPFASRLGVGLSVLSTVFLTSCGSSTASISTGNQESIQRPTTVNLLPVQSAAYESRLYILVTGVGAQIVNMPLAFDTGSAGITLYALDVLPDTIVTPAGFLIPAGQSTITHGGITVTNQQAV